MSRQLICRFRPAACPRLGGTAGRPTALLLAVVCLFLIVVSGPGAHEALSPAVAAQDQSAKQPKAGRVKLIDTLTGHKFPVWFAAFTNGGKTLVSGSGPFKGAGLEIKSWDVALCKNKTTISAPDTLTNGWAISPNGETLAVGLGKTISNGQPDYSTGKIRLYEVSNNKKPREIDSPGFPCALAFSPDGKVLALGDNQERKVRLWNLAAGKLIGTLASPKDSYVESVAFNLNGNTLASGHTKSLSRLWDVATGNNTQIFQEGKDWQVYRLAFSPDGNTLAVGVYNPTSKGSDVRLWDVATGKNIRTLTGNASFINSLAFNKDGKVLAVGADKAKLWNVATGKNLITLALHDGEIGCVAFSPDSRTLATGSADKTIRLWTLPADTHTFPSLELDIAIPK